MEASRLVAILLLLAASSEGTTFLNVTGVINRFLVVPTTVTSTVTASTTSTTTISASTSCASLLSATVACRRRRHAMYGMPIMARDMGIQASPPEAIETTPDIWQMKPDYRAATEQELYATTPADVLIQPSIENTPGVAEVIIQNLGQVCEQQGRNANPFFGAVTSLPQLFGITVLYSTTITSTRTIIASTTRFTRTNTFVISSCTPSPFPYSIC